MSREESRTTLKALEPYADAPAKTVPVIELFGPTIQGEGVMIGVKTMFVRFGGCDYRCGRCDSMHAVDPQAVKANASWVTQEDIFKLLLEAKQATGVSWVTLSGGNPTMWDLGLLVELCHEAGIKVAVETQGSIWRDWLRDVDQLTISPKGPGMEEKFKPEIFKKFISQIGPNTQTCVKIPVFGQMDLEFALEVDDILDTPMRWEAPIEELGKPSPHANKERIVVDRESRYLSVGNYLQPLLGEDLQLHDPAIVAEDGLKIQEELLTSYRNALEMDYLPDPRISHWKFLPQLHVLVWANKAKV
ncbi:7-carboxy-7-deazaguanine synthase [Brevundimonas phage vB_BpoS-StAshley]|nr:7-carboxy-7-deazaguanine synthase [Brevundimonas phage vB_BpoS-StAshley]